jgi:diguanylate cyclase (GGDEF)-like protein/PAS domain S-box-containing protein
MRAPAPAGEAVDVDGEPGLTGIGPTDFRPADLRPADLRPTDLRPADLRPADPWLDDIPVPLVVCRRDGTTIRVNRAAAELTGVVPAAAIGQPIWRLFSTRPPGSERRWAARLTTPGAAVHDERVVAKPGEPPRVVRITARVTDDGSHIVIVGHDVTAEREGERQLRAAAETDALTGLVNRPVLAAHLERFVTAKPDGAARGSLLFADLDQFKRVNDEYGHPIGDEVLATISQRLRGTVRRGDIVARFGGDEFAVFCPALDAGGAADLARRLRAAVAEPITTVDGCIVHVGISVGTVPVAPGDDWRELIAVADRHMYDAKRAVRPVG